MTDIEKKLGIADTVAFDLEYSLEHLKDAADAALDIRSSEITTLLEQALVSLTAAKEAVDRHLTVYKDKAAWKAIKDDSRALSKLLADEFPHAAVMATILEDQIEQLKNK